jgi:hypothetical protein
MSVDANIGNEGMFIQSDRHSGLLKTILHERELGKGCYGRADAALMELLQSVPPGTTLDLDGKKFELQDKFSKGNTVFVHAGCKHFDVVEVREK